MVPIVTYLKKKSFLLYFVRNRHCVEVPMYKGGQKVTAVTSKSKGGQKLETDSRKQKSTGITKDAACGQMAQIKRAGY